MKDVQDSLFCQNEAIRIVKSSKKVGTFALHLRLSYAILIFFTSNKVMRNKIDELILINLLWFIIGNIGLLLHVGTFFFVVIAGAFLNLVYDFILFRKTKKMVDAHYQPRLFKRIFYNMLFSICFVIFSVALLFF